MEKLTEAAPELNSRSAWYHAVDSHLGALSPRFKMEVIDTAYHGLFVGSGEAFAAGRIPIFDKIPPKIMDAGLTIRALQKEKELIGFALQGMDIVSAYGLGEITKYLLDEAVSYIEDKLEDTTLGWFTRKNWFGLYPKLVKTMGVEIK